MRLFLSAFVLISGLCFGSSAALKSFGGTFFVSNSKYVNARNPAYVQKLSQFSELKGTAWNLLSHDRLLAEAFAIKETDRTGLVFGHFITQDNEGKKYFACDIFNKIELSFVAEGISEGGDLTRMKVQAPCHATADLNTLEPIWIPQMEILKQHPSPNLSLDFPANDLHISFTNLTSEWPRQWVLEDVQLRQDVNATPALDMDSQQINRLAKQPLNLHW